MKKVYIDCGHGGYDSGAIGVNNVLEKNIVLAVGKMVEVKCKKCGIEVRMSRTTDKFQSLSYRTNDVNNWGADAFVSIHCNSFNKTAKGLETYCYKLKYRPLADAIHSEIKSAGLYNNDRGVKEGNLHVVRESNMDACLVELAFIDNVDDVKLLNNKQEEFAVAITKGICKHLGVKYVDENPTFDGQFSNGEYDGRKGIVLASELNVRYDRWINGVAEPKVVGVVKQGQVVDLGYCLNGWVALKGFNGNKGFGYVNSKYIKLT